MEKSRITVDDLKKVKTYSLSTRKSIASRADFGVPASAGASLRDFLTTLPKIYMAKDLLLVAKAVRDAKEHQKVCHFAMGSHVIKNGLGPYVLDLMKQGYVTALSFNGSALVHDFEIAFMGATSEDVDSQIGEGKFGLAEETAQSINRAVKAGSKDGHGLGKSVGLWIQAHTPHPEDSLLAEAVRLGIPATVHLAVGTDIVHIHPSFDPAASAKASYQDFLEFASSVANLEGGVYLNIGSAVILPEVFLKAISLVRNLGHRVDAFCAVNIDFIRHYRSRRNVLERPTAKGGSSIEIIGAHELVLPLLHAAIVCEAT